MISHKRLCSGNVGAGIIINNDDDESNDDDDDDERPFLKTLWNDNQRVQGATFDM